MAPAPSADAADRSALADPDRLRAAQSEVGALTPPHWRPPPGPLVVAGCFVAFERGEQGPGHAGDRAWVGAALVDEVGVEVDTVLGTGRADGAYVPGLLAVREGTMLLDVLESLLQRASRPPDLVLVDATGRDHPRRCGVAVHLGHLLDLPTVGVTHRLLSDHRAEPPPLTRRGQHRIVHLDGQPVAAWVCTQDGARPVVAHAAWRTDVDAAVEVALRTAPSFRTPEPLRVARRVAREARSHPPPVVGRSSDTRSSDTRSRDTRSSDTRSGDTREVT